VRITSAATLLLLDLAAFTWLACWVRRRPLPFALAAGMGLLVAWQALVSTTLSLFGAVNGPALGVTAILPVAGMAFVLARSGDPDPAVARGVRALRWAVRCLGWQGLLLLPPIAIVTVVAATHAPANWDSMTYHLARVAHWIQRGSVFAYETNVLRQNLYTPGAEYILLALQAIAGTDRLANGLQMVAWLLVLGCAGPLAKICGVPRDVARWAGPLVASAPMLVLQATSTQNDLVAATLVLGLVTASLPFLHGKQRPRWPDVLLLATLLAAAFLVKATAVVCAAPLLVLVLARGGTSLRTWPARRATTAILGGAFLALAVAGPQAIRMVRADARSAGLTAPFVFPLSGEWNARGANVCLALARHLPASWDVRPDLAGAPSALPRFHEDLAANPVQAVLAIVGILLLALGWLRVAPRARWAGAMAVSAWLLFQVIFRSNDWISRLETPLFAVLPATMAGLGLIRPGPLRQAVLGVGAAIALVFGLAAAIHNPTRPPGRSFTVRSAADDYYVNRPDQRPMHDAALDVAAKVGCTRIGLLVGEDSYDYPLTWRAMQRGIEVRHVLGPDGWPCVLASDRGPPPPPGPGEGVWRPVLQVLSGPGPGATVAGGVWVRRR
jgi:hypothetical protein